MFVGLDIGIIVPREIIFQTEAELTNYAVCLTVMYFCLVELCF